MPMLIYCKGRVCRNQPYQCWDSHGTDAFSKWPLAPTAGHAASPKIFAPVFMGLHRFDRAAPQPAGLL